MDWYAVYVETGKEHVVEKQLMKYFKQEEIVKSLIPSKIITERKEGTEYRVNKILYPGYIFIKLKMTPSIFHTLMRIPKILYLLRTNKEKNNNENGYYSRIQDDEMAFLLRLTGENGVIGFSEIRLHDKQLSVLSGPLLGLESLIIKVDKRKNRVKLRFPLIGELKTISLGARFNFL